MVRSRKLVSWPIWLWFLMMSLLGRTPTALAAELRFEPRPGEPPALALTASDGTGLRLVSLRARAVVEDPLAFTELHLVFENPEPRMLEGRFEIRLPPSASLSRLAMKVGTVWQEGEVVERQRARRVYEDFLHRKQDPALLEQGAGNLFTARVFPIGAREKKEIIVSYSQTVTEAATALVPLSGLPELQELDAAVHAAGGVPYRVRVTKQRPRGDLVYVRGAGAALPALRNADLAVLSLRAPVDERVDELDGVLVLVDTSASGALDLQRRVEVVRRLAASIATARFAVLAFDQTAELLFDGVAGAAGADVWSRLARRGALGATNLEQALARAGEIARGKKLSRLVLVGDGIATAGPTAADALARAAAALRGGGVERIDVVASGELRDQAVLEALTRADLPRAGVIVSSDAPAAEIVRRLRQRAHADIRVELPDATWYAPRVVRGLQSGDEFHVFARLPAGRPLRVRVGSEAPRAVTARRAPRPLLERAWAKAKIDSLLSGPPRAEALRQIVELSTRHRVLSPFTALLVLESGAEYERYQLDRRALADVLTVVDGRLSVVQRAAPRKTAGGSATLPSEPDSAAGPWDSLWGSEAGPSAKREAPAGSGAGLSAVGQGAGHGRMAGTHRTRAPQIRAGATRVSGRLPPETIQRIVRQNFGRFRVCYERGLSRKPRLAGRVLARFVIARDGSVRSVTDGGSTLADADVVRCVLEAFTRLSFPAPPGDPVQVVYPLAFSPEGTPALPVATKPVEPPVVVREAEWPREAGPYTGRFGDVMEKLARRDLPAALRHAEAWQREAPGDVMALLALGEALEASSDRARAARAYGSLIDLYPTRADLRRYAGARLERVGGGGALSLARDTFEKALADRPDHATGHRLTAYALLRDRQHRRAFEVLARALEREDFRDRGVMTVLRDDLGLVAAAWLKAAPKERSHIALRLRSLGVALPKRPAVHFVLGWETDANDVDLHVYDGRGGHAFYGRPRLPDAGELSPDVQNGYGPESFTLSGKLGGPYTLQAHYYARGPMGFGMGKLQIIAHDGQGGITLEDRPFVVMTDGAFVDLGVYTSGS